MQLFRIVKKDDEPSAFIKYTVLFKNYHRVLSGIEKKRIDHNEKRKSCIAVHYSINKVARGLLGGAIILNYQYIRLLFVLYAYIDYRCDPVPRFSCHFILRLYILVFIELEHQFILQNRMHEAVLTLKQV